MRIKVMLRRGRLQLSVAVFTILFGVAACDAKTSIPKMSETKPKILPPGSEVGLTLAGYNYTNKYIDDFSVNSISGGNLFVSDSVNGGGGSTCCVGYITGVKDWKIPIRFHIGSCTYDTQTDSTGKIFSRTHNFYKEMIVRVDPNIAERPYYFEVHIYPDNRIEAIVTENSSPAKLLLNKEREDKTPYKQCPDDKRPEK